MTTSHIKPPRVLKATVDSIDVESTWLEGPEDDAYFGYPYRWTYHIKVDPQEHGDFSVASPYYYDGLDIKVGDWLSSSLGGVAVQIVQIISQDNSAAVVIGEDIERYNLLLEPVSNSSLGSGVTGDAVIFELSDDGLPVVGPLPPNYFPATLQADLISRFRYRNLMRSFVRVNQPGHTMALGDMIRPDFANPGKFEKALADGNVASVIGVVSDVNIPSDGWFNFKPFGEIRENINPPLVGSYGDFFYVDPTTPGALTRFRPFNNARPIYMRLDNATRGLLIAGGSNQDTNETKRYEVPSPAGDQVNFTLPADAETVLWMSINGIENTEFTFDVASKGLVFDPTATGYGVDVTDEVFFVYKS